ncbi:MAG: hypothetical protein RBJ76_25360 [Stenomitos frigidus ULC029]
MLRQDPSSTSPDHGFSSNASAHNGTVHGDTARSGNIDIQRELNRLEEMILDSPRVPMTRWTWVDEEQLLEQLDLVRLSLPEAFHEAETIARQKDELFLQAEQYAQGVVENAERQAAQILNEMGILRQAEIEAQQIRQQAQQKCEAAEAQTIAEIERIRRQAQQELEEMQRLAIAECEEIQAGADEYADRVLQEMELQLGEMMRVVRNGRQQLQPEPPLRTREANAREASTNNVRSSGSKGDRSKS